MLDGLQGVHRVLARLLYGTGMRITEGLQLRVKDVDFAHRALMVHEGKGGKDRAVMLPDALVAALRDQLGAARQLWAADVEAGRAGVATTMICTHVLKVGGMGARSPLDAMLPAR